MCKVPKIEISKNKIGDFYWAYSDILRGIGINESTYDQRIMAFMALKLLIDNEKLQFNFEYWDKFGLTDKQYAKYNAGDTKQTFLNIITDIKNLGTDNLKYFIQEKKLNPNNESIDILDYINHKSTFALKEYIEELPNNYLEMVLEIYITKAHFKDYPREKYKDLYETTISRMKKMSGDLTGQHFTQKSIIHLMCENVVDDLANSSNDILAIYDPTCGTGSMLMESAYYFQEKIKKSKSIKVYGQEMHGQTWLLCKIFLELCGIENEIAYGNTLTNPAFDKINGSDSFDFIIANPPFGVDWKHDYDDITKNMSLGKKSNFLQVSKNDIITPKKSDGQFLFMLHILKLLEVSKKHKKHAKASVISSTGLITSGRETSSEGIIRQKIFKDGWVDTLIEQPKAMFTNTDISTLIWFFDNKQSKKNKTYLIKINNSYVNNHFKNKELKVLYATAQNKKDKQKNSYSDDNIKSIVSLMYNKIEFPLFAKTITFKDKYTINFENIMSYDIDISSIDSMNKFDISESYQALSLSLLFIDQVNSKYKDFKLLIDKLSAYIDGTYIDKFYVQYQNIYVDMLSMIKSNKKGADSSFIKKIIRQKNIEFKEINNTFEDIKSINEKVSIKLDMK
ncbi:MAG: N-6 DNA methylase [Epsilonproteobacteria bacterium]|nr:MAG: N-6 DNA methylase [Campylobacterota bacterium]